MEILKKLSNRQLLRELHNYIMIFIGTAFYGGGVALFMLPYKLATGGVTGVSALIYYVTGFEVQYSYLIINLLFLAVALKIMGWRFCVKTIYGVATCTFWIWAWQQIAVMPDGTLPLLCGTQSFMACVIGAMMVGFGLSVCFLNNGSTGGTDIIAACVNKYKDVSLGQMVLACDVIIISSCYFVFHDVQKIIFGCVMMAVCSLSLDYCIRRQRQVVEIKVYSRNYRGVADAVNKAGFGVTVMDGEGWWTKSERKVVVSVASRRYYPMIANAIQRVDPYAFVSVSSMMGVYGEGFETMKTKVKNQKPILVFATNSANKLREVRQILDGRFEVRSLNDIGCHVDIPENEDTLEGNALAKARFIKKYFGFDCFADDTGLEVESLGGEPGVYSARYANVPVEGYEDKELDPARDHDSRANMRKLLWMLRDKQKPEERKARFRTVVALIYNDKEYLFDGVVNGLITTEQHGTEGFGYDPIFRPEGYDTTFAEMDSEAKNSISHRGRAVAKLVEFLSK